MKNREADMKKLSLLSLIILITLLTNFLSACNGSYYSNTGKLDVIMEKRFPISWGKDLIVKVNSGDLIVNSWDKSEVYIKILGNEKARERLEFKFDNNDSYVELITESKGTLFNWFNGLSLKIEIMVPEKFNSQIQTSGGDINLMGVAGNHQLKTSGGDVVCKSFTGILEVSTSGGDVTLEGSYTSINAHTSGGDIVLDYSGKNMGIDLSTSGGDIRVKLPNDFNAAMELSTSGGDVSCDLTMNNVTKLTEHKIVAELNNGGKDFVAHTSGGDIQVRKK